MHRRAERARAMLRRRSEGIASHDVTLGAVDAVGVIGEGAAVAI